MMISNRNVDATTSFGVRAEINNKGVMGGVWQRGGGGGDE